MRLLVPALFLLLSCSFGTARPKRGRGDAYVNIAKKLQTSVQSGTYKEVKRWAKKASRYKNKIHFVSFAWLATLRGEEEIVKEIFVAGKGSFEVNERHPKTGGTLLHAAAWAGYDKVVQFLLSQGADPFAKDSSGNNAVHAVLTGWKHLFFNMHGIPKDSAKPRKAASTKGHELSLVHISEWTKSLKLWGKENDKLQTPLLIAVLDFNSKALQVMLENIPGIDVNLRDPLGAPLLNVALDTAWFVIRASKWLTGHGNVAVPPSQLDMYPNSDLHDSFELVGLKNSGELGAILLANGTSYNRTRLNELIFTWHTNSILSPLLKAGCPVRLTDSALKSPFHVAAHQGNRWAVNAMLESLESSGKNAETYLQKTNALGLTALQTAITSTQESTIASLVTTENVEKEIERMEMYNFQPESLQKERGGQDKKVVLAMDADELVATNVVPEMRIAGWRSERMFEVGLNLSEAHCDLDVLTDANKTLFKSYMKRQKPVVLRQVSDVMSWPAFTKWSRERIYEQYGDEDFMVYKRTDTTRPTSFKMKLSEYLDYMDSLHGREPGEADSPMWLVDTSVPSRAKEMVEKDVGKFEFYEHLLGESSKGKFGYNNYQLMIAPAKAGASPHFHNSALNLLVFGEKLWLLYPPSVAFYSTKHVHSWFREDYSQLLSDGVAPLKCLQQPGDVIWVPDMWGHGVIYTKDSVGIAHLYSG